MRQLLTTSFLVLLFSGLGAQDYPQADIGGHYLFRLDNILALPPDTGRDLRFDLRRAYFDLKLKLSERFVVRWTPDVMFKNSDTPYVRLKYAYATYSLGDYKFFDDIKVSVGQLPRPWLSYQERFNKYKVFEDMFLETAGLVNSTDRGISVGASLGGILRDERVVGEKGKFGSVMFGFYNGGGYMQPEVNSSKTFEFRLSLRPFYRTLPNLLYVVTGVTGKTNLRMSVPLVFDSTRVLFANQYLVYAGSDITVSFQFEIGQGDVFGTHYVTYVPTDSGLGAVSREHWGLSAFGDFRIFPRIFVFGRYDYFRINKGPQVLNTAYAGFRYEINTWSFVALQYRYERITARHTVTAGLQIKF